MAVTEEIRIEIKTQVSQAIAGLKQVESTSDKLLSSIKKLGIAAAAAFSVNKIVDYAKASIKAYAEAEASVVKLNAALKATGQFSESTSRDLRDFATEMMRITVVDDDAAVSLLQVGVNMGLTAEQSKEATKGAIGLSRAYGVDLDSAMKAVAGAMQGSTAALSRYMPQLKSATSEADKMRMVQEGLASAFDVAKAETDSVLGTQEQLKNSLGELREAFGYLAATELKNTNKVMKDFVDRMADAITKAAELKIAVRAMEEGSATYAQKLLVAQDALKKLRQESALVQARSGMSQLMASPYAKEIKELEAQIATLGNLASAEAMREGQKADNAKKEEKRLADEDAAAIKRQADTDALIARNQKLLELKDRMFALAKAGEEAGHTLFMSNIEAEWAARAETQRIIEEVAAAEKAAHDQKIADMQTELQMYGDMAGSVATIFSNLIAAQMSGDEKLSDEKKKNIIALFRLQQAAAIAQVAINTAVAMSRQYADLPVWLAVASKVLVAAMGATQIGVIAATKPPVALAEGGIVMPTPGGTNALIAEAGKPEAVIPLDRLGGLGGNITVNVYGTVGSQEDVATWVYEGITRARQMGKVA
jgi:phage-related minor tail protein